MFDAEERCFLESSQSSVSFSWKASLKSLHGSEQFHYSPVTGAGTSFLLMYVLLYNGDLSQNYFTFSHNEQ